MKYCPNCEAEYFDHVTMCADCNIQLIQTKPFHCPSCTERIEGDNTFCPHCGILVGTSDPKIACETHTEAEAIGMCVICGRAVCSECVVEREGKKFCGDDSHILLHQDYALVYQTSAEYEAAMIQSNLQGAGIEAKIFSQHDHVYLVNMGNLAVENIMVPKSQIHEAEEVLKTILAHHDLDESNSEAPEQQ